MQIDLIDYTGAGYADPLYAARLLVYAKSTRLVQGTETRMKITMMPEEELMTELKEVANSVRSSWEFVEFKFEIKGISRACANQITRSRYGVAFAQQAMRVADMKGFSTRVPQTVIDAGKASMWEYTMEEIEDTYKRLQNAGIPNQDARGVLPLNIHTNLLGRWDLRALADMCGKRDNPRAQDEYTEVAMEMKRLVYSMMPWTKIFIEPERTSTPALDTLMRKLLGSASPVDKPELNAALKDIDKLRATWG